MQSSNQTFDTTRYPERALEGLGIWVMGSHRLKAYGLFPAGNSLTKEDQEKANRLVHSGFARFNDNVDPRNFGFVLIHKGTEGLTVSAHWWVEGCVLCHDHYRMPFHGDDPLAHLRAKVVGCVWELEVIGFEQRAWRQTMMQGIPDPDAYLQTWMDQGTV